MRYRKAVFIVTYRKARPRFCKSYTILYLVLKRKLHWTGWEFPKGGMENGENLTSSVKRELEEETGQITSNIKKFKEEGKYRYDKEYPDRKGIIGQTYTLFSAELKSKKIKLDKKEHSDYKWLSFKKAEKILTWKNQKECLRIVNNFMSRTEI